MKSFKHVLFAAIALAAGAAMADTSVVNMDSVSQSQSGSRNTQKLELGTVDGGVLSGGTARVTARNIRQTQSGTSNTQEMILGKIDKDALGTWIGRHKERIIDSHQIMPCTMRNGYKRWKIERLNNGSDLLEPTVSEAEQRKRMIDNMCRDPGYP